MKVRPTVWLVAALVVVVDQLTKQWALHNLEPGVKKPIFGDWLSLELVFNDGAAFSFGSGYTWFLSAFAVAVTVGIIYFARRAQSDFAAILFGLALGGAIGNLIDRLFRDPGFGEGRVVDMINYNNWFVGNVADIAIVGAAFVFVIMGIFGRRVLEPAQGEEESAEADAAAGAQNDAQPGDAAQDSPDAANGA